MNNRQGKIIPGCEPLYYEGNSTGCLLLHGFTGSPYELRLLGDFLHNEGYTISIPLMPGHGTKPEDLRKRTWFEWYEKAKSELFELRKKCTKVFVMGLSMGGALALHLSAHYEVNGVIALAPALYLKNKCSFLSHYLHIIYPYTKKGAGSDIKAKTKTMAYDKIPLKSLSEMLKFSKHLKNDLPDIYTPALIIYSRKDHVVDEKGPTEIYRRLASKNKRILELQKSYHVITLDIEKEKAFREINNFLKDTT